MTHKERIPSLAELPLCQCGSCQEALDTAMKIVCDEIKAENDCVLWHQTVDHLTILLRQIALGIDPTMGGPKTAEVNAMDEKQKHKAVLIVGGATNEILEKLMRVFADKHGIEAKWADE